MLRHNSDPRAPTQLDATGFVEALTIMPGMPRNGAPAPLATKTICKRVAILRKLYNLAIEQGEATTNPFRLLQLKKPRTPEKRRCEEFPPALVPSLFLPHVTIRNRALMAVLFGGALRIGEAIGLQVGDVEMIGDQTILVLRHTKAGEPQEQPLPTWAAKHVKKYLEIRKGHMARDYDPLFTSKGRRMTIRQATIQFVNEGARVGAYGLYPHSARRCAITKLLRDGVPLADVQRFSRHAALETLLDYDKRRMTREHHPAHLLKF